MKNDLPKVLPKIIATLGPASSAPEQVERLIEEGASVFRINFSHGNFDQFAQALNTVRAVSEKLNLPIAVLGDLPGPKIRLTEVEGDGFDLRVGDRVEFQGRPDAIGKPRRDGNGVCTVVLSSNYAPLVNEVKSGQRLLIDDGNVRLLAVDKTDDTHDPRIICTVTTGGRIRSHKGLNLPDTELSVPSITERDWQLIDWAIEHDLDYLALSFVRRADDMVELQSYLKSKGRKGKLQLPVIAKIEKPEAIDDLDRIASVADVIMVARGDLGVEMELTQVPAIQKQIIKVAHDHGKPVIVATQMLQSMIESTVPTRAEVSDVANAIFDGADVVMLSGETAVGKAPAQAVHVMSNIARESQRHLGGPLARQDLEPGQLAEGRYRTAALAKGVGAVVRRLEAKLVVTWSQLGGTARYLSKNRFLVPCIAFSSSARALRRMSLLFGVTPVFAEQPESVDTFIHTADRWILEHELAEAGDPIVFCAGEPIGTPGVTNSIRIHYLGDVVRVRWKVKDD